MTDWLTLLLPAGYHLDYYPTLDTTMNEAQRLIESGQAQDRQLIIAGEMGSGRGRQGRAWQAQPGNLYATLILNIPSEQAAIAPQLTFVMSLAILEGVTPFCLNRSLQLKWPNDVLLDDAKLSGLLIEAHTYNDQLWYVFGFGINVSFAPEIANYKTACLELPITDLPIVAGNCVTAFEKWLKIWHAEGFAKIRQNWLNHAKGIGTSITARTGQEDTQGTFSGIDETGALQLTLVNGQQQRIHAADIFFN